MNEFPKVPAKLERIFPTHPLYFVTCCTERRRPILANKHVHEAFVSFSKRAHRDHNVAVGRYVIMPDHLHFFVLGDAEFVLGSWIGSLKRVLEKPIRQSEIQGHIWQRRFFDRVLRSSESYSEKWHYVWENPVRAGLVDSAEAWPFAGEIVDIYFD